MTACAVRVAKAINTFGSAASPAFKAYIGATVPTSVTDSAEPFVTVRETDREDIGMTSDPAEELDESYVELYVDAASAADAAAIEGEILKRQRDSLGAGGEEVQWILSEVETIKDGRDSRFEQVVELRVFWVADYSLMARAPRTTHPARARGRVPPGPAGRRLHGQASWRSSWTRSIKTRLLRACMRAAAGVIRTELRRAIRKYRDSGDLGKAVMVQIRRAKRSKNFYAIIGFRYGKFGNPPRSTQDPAVYAAFLHGGATRRNRGRVRKTNFGEAVTRQTVIQAAVDKFASTFRSQLTKLRG